MTAVMEPEASAEMLASLPAGDIHPSPANPRRSLGDLAELAASIAELGVVEPLIVTPAATDGWDLVAGHRRLAAAIEAGLDEVPCIVRHGLDERAQAELRIVENLHRQDLTPLEEAAAYAQLVDLGLSQRALAKRVSRSQPHVSRRLSLLKLPDAARTALDAGGITVEQATVLARLPADKVKALFKRGTPRHDYEIDAFVRRQEREETLAAARKALREAGVVVLDDMPGPAWKHALRGPGAYGMGFTPEEHAAEPCHAAVVSDQYGRAVDSGGAAYVCTDPERHEPSGDSALKKPRAEEDDEVEDAEGGEVDEEEQARRDAHRTAQEAGMARRAEREEAIEGRRLFAAEALRSLSAEDVIDLVCLAFAEVQYMEEPFDDRLVAQLLGIPEDTYAGVPPGDKVREFMGRGTRNQARALAAVAAASLDRDATPNPYALAYVDVHLDADFMPSTRAWLSWLVAHGYELSDHDRELIPEPKPPAEVAPDDAVAWYDDPEEGARWVDAGEASAIGALDADRLHFLPGQPSAAELEDLGVSLAVQEGVRAMEDELDSEGAESLKADPPGVDQPGMTVKKSGKRWKARCGACGALGANTTEAYAVERGEAHLRDVHDRAAQEATA